MKPLITKVGALMHYVLHGIGVGVAIPVRDSQNILALLYII
jgi:hypothetical protein